MDDTLLLITGIVLLAIGIYDFFFTTLSGSGAGFLSKAVLYISDRIIQMLVSHTSRKMYAFSGLVITMMVLTVWVVLVWAGLFLVFSFQPGSITDSNGIPASAVERLYFTGYVLSTLGIGNFKPTTPGLEMLTSFFSFYGFVFFTTSMTYLISVSSAVVHKRSMSLSIHRLGNSPREIADYFLKSDNSYSLQLFLSLHQMIDKHSVYHHAYPITHFYSNPDQASSFSLNLTRLDEALSMLFATGRADQFRSELLPLRKSISHLLIQMQQSYSRSLKQIDDPDISLPQYESIPEEGLESGPGISSRRKILSALLQNEGFNWKDVYEGAKF